MLPSRTGRPRPQPGVLDCFSNAYRAAAAVSILLGTALLVVLFAQSQPSSYLQSGDQPDGTPPLGPVGGAGATVVPPSTRSDAVRGARSGDEDEDGNQDAPPCATAPETAEGASGVTGAAAAGEEAAPSVRDCLPEALKDVLAHADQVAAALPTGGLQDAYRKAYVLNMQQLARATQAGNETFVLTGDIPAMWLRDSAAQFHVYVDLARQSRCVRVVVEGLVREMAIEILRDVYANSFHERPTFRDLSLGRGQYVHTRNYEVDSLAYFVRLAYVLWAHTGATGHFDSRFFEAGLKVAAVWKYEQRHESSIYSYPELQRSGRGPPTEYTGMTWNAFRPSDDPCQYSYHVPVNVMAAEALGQLAEILVKVYGDQVDADFCLAVAQEIRTGIEKAGLVDAEGDGGSKMYVYETDGKGNHVLMDDANVPSLLSLPYLKVPAGDGVRDVVPFPAPTAESLAADPHYLATRSWVVNPEKNPWYFRGIVAEGVGSPHTGSRLIWPMAVIVRGLTSADRQERRQALKWALATTAGTGLQHESLDPNNPGMYTRALFGWPNALFAEFVEQMLATGELRDFG